MAWLCSLSSRATITPGTVSTTGYYDYENCTYDSLLDHGFVNAQPGDKQILEFQSLAPAQFVYNSPEYRYDQKNNAVQRRTENRDNILIDIRRKYRFNSSGVDERCCITPEHAYRNSGLFMSDASRRSGKRNVLRF
jgi:hypothetical protein